jgi:hypothetical protein
MESVEGEGDKKVVKIGIKTTIYFPEAPKEIEIAAGATLGDALWALFAGTHFEGQVVDRKSGKIALQDMWEIRVNDAPSYSLPRDLDTELHEGDIITLSLILLGGG